MNLTDEHKVYLSSVERSLRNSEETQKYMKGNNSEENIRNYMMEQYDNELLGFVQTNLEFYQKMVDNPSVKSMIFDTMYRKIRDSSEHIANP